VLCPWPWTELYPPEEIACQARNRPMYNNRSDWDRQLANEQGGFELSMDAWRYIWSCYFGLCAHIDHQAGRLLRALDVLGLRDRTIVAYTSDHGKGLGEYGACEKVTYDREVWRVPLILSWPGQLPEGERRSDLVESLDIGPTAMGLCGVRRDERLPRGRNLADSAEPEAVFGVINRGGKRTLEAFHAQEDEGVLRIGVRTKRWRMDYTRGYFGKPIPLEKCDPGLFDLERDPAELRNLGRQPAFAEVVKRLRELGEAWFSRYENAAIDGRGVLQ
jgi:choline-sulfatase